MGDDFVAFEEKLYMLIFEGKKDEIMHLDVNLYQLKSNKDKNSVLHIAASAGQAQLIAEILPMTKGIVTWKNIKGDLPFHSAARALQYDSLKALMNWGKYDPLENINAELLGLGNDAGETSLHIALENNQQQMARLLVDEYWQACYKLNKKNESALYVAIKSRCWELVKHMISYTKQHKTASEPQLLKGMPIVHAVIDANNIEILKEILSSHEDLIKSVDVEDYSPISYAASVGSLEEIEYLVKKFPEYAYKCDKFGYYPIHRAAERGDMKVIKALHHTKKLRNSRGQSILHVAAMWGKSEIVSHLIRMQELEELINHKDDDGNTPLHLAAKYYKPKVVSILTRSKRCNLGMQNKDGLTPLAVGYYIQVTQVNYNFKLV